MSIASVYTRKRRHASEKCARKALAAQLASLPPALPITRLIVYKCPHCPGWHVGHELPAAVVEESAKKGGR